MIIRRRYFSGAVRTLLAAIILGAAACSGDVLATLARSDDNAFARAYLDSVRSGNADYAFSALSPAVSAIPGVRDSIARVITYLPAGPLDSFHVIGANRFTTSNFERTTYLYEYHSARGWGVARVTVASELGKRYIDGLWADTLARSLEVANDFTFQGKSAGHYLMLALVIACLGTAAAGVVLALRTPMPRRWLWALLSLVGAGAFAFNWTTGQARFSLFTVLLLDAAVTRAADAAPWILQAAFPVGALMTFRRVRQARAPRLTVNDVAAVKPDAE